uniref:Uncharacterized protein n=1 Tax=uncultured marine virus TaxID=186617 RepID=A0A0F7L4R7_9VIRU|nr:hypothetical protein [uncultured marine virus]
MCILHYNHRSSPLKRPPRLPGPLLVLQAPIHTHLPLQFFSCLCRSKQTHFARLNCTHYKEYLTTWHW